MPSKLYDRRRVLRGLLATGGAIAMPLPIFDYLLNSNGTAFAADGAPLPVRFVSWFFGNGILPPRWVPARTGDDWALSEQLTPLAAFKEHLTVISGLARKVGGGAHPGGSAGATTGSANGSGGAQVPSIDQIVADTIGTKSPFKSIEVGVTPATPNGNEQTLHSVSHRGPNQVLYPEFNPAKVFSRLFSGASTTGAPQMGNLLALKRSVCDSVLADGKDLSSLLGAQDKQRLEAHLDGIRAIEARLAGSTSTAGQCGSQTAPTQGPDLKSEAPPALNTVMSDLTVLALSCNLTNVATFTFSLPAAHVYYRHLGADMNDDFHNNICHVEPGDATQQPRVHTGVLYAMQCLAEFLTKMKAVSQGDSDLLTNSLVYVTSCTAWGKTHGTTDWPVLMLGKAGGRLKGNSHFKFPDENLSRALFTAAQIMGSPIKQLGKAEGLVSSELPGVRLA